MPFLYETHLHTVEASACAKTPGKDYPSFMKRKGYDGIIVTDHFFNGNSCVPRSLPWKERVHQYCQGYIHALEAASDMDFSVFFGVEFNFKGDEYLIYGIEPDWLSDHPEIMELDRVGVYELVHAAGGIMVHAHPYRERDYLNTIYLTPGITDAVEVFNAGNEDYQNALDYVYAQELGVPVTAGSDIHHAIDKPLGGMLFDRKLTSSMDYARAVMAGEGTPVYVTDSGVIPVAELSAQCRTDRSPYLPVVRHEDQIPER